MEASYEIEYNLNDETTEAEEFYWLPSNWGDWYNKRFKNMDRFMKVVLSIGGTAAIAGVIFDVGPIPIYIMASLTAFSVFMAHKRK